jgi:hypothetical protein
MTERIVFAEEGSGLAAHARLLSDRAPEAVAFLKALLASPRRIPAIHAMWTGPEISCPVPPAMVPAAFRGRPLPLENGTLFPAAGDVLLAYVPPRAWEGAPEEVFDIGLFHGPGGRLLLPIGWCAASLAAQVEPAGLSALAAAGRAFRRNGAASVTISLEA